MKKINSTHINQYITFRDSRRNSISGGTYIGIKKSEWDGEPVHFFKNGHINGIPQSCFSFPVDQTNEHEII